MDILGCVEIENFQLKIIILLLRETFGPT